MQRSFTDQMNRQIKLPYPPKRIVSLVPSQTELLHFLGLNEEVVGITKFCVHPGEWFRNKTRVGGTKKVKTEVIAKLQPDLIIGNKEENEQSQIKFLAERYPIWMSDIQTMPDALQMIGAVGSLVGKEESAKLLVKKINAEFNAWKQEYSTPIFRAAYFIWREPYMVAAANTFIHELLQFAGFDNVFVNQNRYPTIELDQLSEAAPEVILLSSEPYPFKNKHFEEFKRVCPKAVIKIVDGELFSWYGSRLLQSVAYFRRLREELGG